MGLAARVKGLWDAYILGGTLQIVIAYYIPFRINDLGLIMGRYTLLYPTFKTLTFNDDIKRPTFVRKPVEVINSTSLNSFVKTYDEKR